MIALGVGFLDEGRRTFNTIKIKKQESVYT